MIKKASDISEHSAGRTGISTLAFLSGRPTPASLVEGIDYNAAGGQRREKVIISVAMVIKAMHEDKASSDIGSRWRLRVR